ELDDVAQPLQEAPVVRPAPPRDLVEVDYPGDGVGEPRDRRHVDPVLLGEPDVARFGAAGDADRVPTARQPEVQALGPRLEEAVRGVQARDRPRAGRPEWPWRAVHDHEAPLREEEHLPDAEQRAVPDRAEQPAAGLA